MLFKEQDVRESEAQIHAFEDTWSWDKDGRVQAVYNDFLMQAPQKTAPTRTWPRDHLAATQHHL